MDHHSVKAKIYSYITSFWHCFNSFFFYKMQYSFPWRRFCVIKLWSVCFSNSKFLRHFMYITILTCKNMRFTQKIHWNTRLAASDVFHLFTQLILSSFNSIIVQMSEKRVIHQIYSKNEWLLLSATFTAKHELVFVLTFENAFS